MEFQPAIAVIPARLGSTRLPRKVLAEINGCPLLWHVWNQVRKTSRLGEPVIATDAEEVRLAVENWGGRAIMTSPDCRSGTQRIASIVDQLPARLIVNVQGDEPLIDPGLLDEFVCAWEENGADLLTPVFPIDNLEDLRSSSVVKVARAQDGRALYFSRSPIPYLRDVPFEGWLEQGTTFWGHVGVYAYRREVLEAYPGLPSSPLETAESLEQLRFLDAGYSIQTLVTGYRPVSVDTPADLERVRERMSRLA